MTGHVCWSADYQRTDTDQTTVASCPVSVRIISRFLFLLYLFCQKLLQCTEWKADEVEGLEAKFKFRSWKEVLPLGGENCWNQRASSQRGLSLLPSIS